MFWYGSEFPYTNIHELNLDWLIRRMRMLEKRIEELSNVQYRAFDRYDYYIDGVNGNDNNDGSENRPFRTLNKFMEMSKEYSAIEGHIVSSGTYGANGFSTIGGCDVRIFGEAEDISVYFVGNENGELNVLNSHFRVENVDFAVRSGNKIVGVNTVFNFTNVHMNDCTIECFGGEVNLSSTHLKWLETHNSFVSCHSVHIKNTDPTHFGYRYINSHVRYRGTSYTEALTGDGEVVGLIDCSTSYIAIQGNIISSATEGHRYYKPIGAQYCTILIDDTVYDNLGNYTVTEQSNLESVNTVSTITE